MPLEGGPMDNLLQTTRDLFVTRPRTLTLAKIAEGTGLTLDWLRTFSQDRSDDYGVRKVQTLYDFLLARR